MSDRENSAMDTVEPMGADSTRQPSAIDPRLSQLARSHQPVLPEGKVGYRSVRRWLVEFPSHTEGKSTTA